MYIYIYIYIYICIYLYIYHPVNGFLENESSIHFWEGKTKAIAFSRKKNPLKLKMSFADYPLTQQNTLEYLRCYLYSNGEPIALKVLKMFNTKLNFLSRQKSYLNFSSGRLLCNTLI